MEESMEDVNVAAVILAAGRGTRMESDLPKVLHRINSRSMVTYVIECAEKVVGQNNIYVVIGHMAEKVKKEIDGKFIVEYALQKNMHGTGDAVSVALKGLSGGIETVLVLNGDVPFIKKSTLLKLIETHKKSHNSVTMLAVELDDPTGYGRIIQNKKGDIICIKEEADADFEEKKVKRVNCGVYCFDRKFLEYAIPRIESENIQKEYYLTDVLEIAADRGVKTGMISLDDWHEVMGINTRAELEKARALFKKIDL